MLTRRADAIKLACKLFAGIRLRTRKKMALARLGGTSQRRHAEVHAENVTIVLHGQREGCGKRDLAPMLANLSNEPRMKNTWSILMKLQWG